jgi:hypothetical protein
MNRTDPATFGAGRIQLFHSAEKDSIGPLLAMAEWDFSSAGPIPGIVNRFVWRFLWESEKTRFKSKTFESETLYDSPAKLVKLS